MKNGQSIWRDVWEETSAAMAHLEQCIETVVEAERAVLREHHARICSEGVEKALALMTESAVLARAQMRAVDFQLTSTVIALAAERAKLQERSKSDVRFLGGLSERLIIASVAQSWGKHRKLSSLTQHQ